MTEALPIPRPYSFPEVLYKAFPCRDYAEAFRAGRIRFSSLQFYKETDDQARSDATEGLGLVRRDGPAGERDHSSRAGAYGEKVETLQLELPEPECFVCCFSMGNEKAIEDLPRHFGNYYIRVASPETLYFDVMAALASDPAFAPNPPRLEAGAVRYDMGHYVGELKDPEAIRKLPWLQKPSIYAEENEYRLHFHCPEDMMRSRDSYTLEIGKTLGYCKVFERKE